MPKPKFLASRLTAPSPAHIPAIHGLCDLEGCDHMFETPSDLAPLADYALHVRVQHDALDGYYWEGDLYRGGSLILVVINRGDGGPNIYMEPKGASRDHYRAEMAAFKTAAAEAFPRVRYEVEDTACAFLDLVDQIGAL